MGMVAHNSDATKKKSLEGRKKPFEVSITPPKGFDRNAYKDLDELLKMDKQKNIEKRKDEKMTNQKATEPPKEEVPTKQDSPPKLNRPYDSVKPIERPPIPKNQAIEKGTAHLDKQKHRENSSEGAAKTVKRGTALTSIPEEDVIDDPKALEKAVLDKYMSAEMPVPLEVLAKLSPSFRRSMIHRLQLKEIKRKPVRVFYETLPQAQVLALSEEVINDLEHCTHVVETTDLAREDWDDHFEVLSQEVNGLPAGAIIQKDVVEQFLNEQDPSERGKVIIVARATEGLRCIFPNLNNHPEMIEALLDMGSQIICIDKEEVIGCGITWDPATFIHMQSANGSLQRTQGLARNVPLTIGTITIYGQLHVIDRAPYKMLLGRPFDVLTKLRTQTFEDGRMDITITCPNTHRQITMGTYERGKGVRPQPLKEPTLVDMSHPEGSPSVTEPNEHNGEPSSSQTHFQETLMN